MPWEAAATVGSAVIGGVASKKGADAQEKAAEKAQDTTWAMYQQTREDMAPYREAGEWALGVLQDRLKSGPGEFTESPGYQFRLGEGEKAINRNMAAIGGLGSGAHKKALSRFAQNAASSEFGNFTNRYYQALNPYFSLAGKGQLATSDSARLGMNTANNIGALQLGAGDAQATGIVNMAGALRGGISDAFSLFQNQNTAQNITPVLRPAPQLVPTQSTGLVDPILSSRIA